MGTSRCPRRALSSVTLWWLNRQGNFLWLLLKIHACATDVVCVLQDSPCSEMYFVMSGYVRLMQRVTARKEELVSAGTEDCEKQLTREAGQYANLS